VLSVIKNKKWGTTKDSPKLPALRVTSTGAPAPGSTPQAPVYNVDTGLLATLTSAGQALPNRPVLLVLKGITTRQTISAVRTTDLTGRAMLGVIALRPDIYIIIASFGVAQPGSSVDPVYAASTTPPAAVVLTPGVTITIVPPPKK
jgi:hypothetical protein